MKNEFRIIDPKMQAKGSVFSPLQTDGHNYLCPECGGYGYVPKNPSCAFCDGSGLLELTDTRVTKIKIYA
jgi:DnaJ-class molecular chaperone